MTDLFLFLHGTKFGVYRISFKKKKKKKRKKKEEKKVYNCNTLHRCCLYHTQLSVRSSICCIDPLSHIQLSMSTKFHVYRISYNKLN